MVEDGGGCREDRADWFYFDSFARGRLTPVVDGEIDDFGGGCGFAVVDDAGEGVGAGLLGLFGLWGGLALFLLGLVGFCVRFGSWLGSGLGLFLRFFDGLWLWGRLEVFGRLGALLDDLWGFDLFGGLGWGGVGFLRIGLGGGLGGGLWGWFFFLLFGGCLLLGLWFGRVGCGRGFGGTVGSETEGGLIGFGFLCVVGGWVCEAEPVDGCSL